MTTPDHHDPLHNEPLSDEERDLAARLGRIGPFDGPSPALDAKILAAAHAAAVKRTPGRRLAWLGVPPALVTGMGVAAAAVLALGLVWQLRPQPGMVATHSEADAGEEVILMAEPAGARPPVANPPPVPEDAAAPRAQAAAPAPTQASRANIAPANAPQREAAAARESASLAAEAAATASVAEEKREAAQVARDAASDTGFVAEPPAAAATRDTAYRRATYTTAARARAEERQRMASKAAAAPAAPAAAPSMADDAPASAAASAEAGTLDRIEVTGTRIGTDWSQVPPSEDTRLAAAEWLERIRARRDGGDTDNARASLRRFQREHPRIRLPDDLRELLADAKR